MSIVAKAKQKTLKYYGDKPSHLQQRACEHASIMQSLENIISYPFVHERLKNGTLSLNGWYFDFESGNLMAYNPVTSEFETLAASVSDQGIPEQLSTLRT
jgi:carbonic anhydrase